MKSFLQRTTIGILKFMTILAAGILFSSPVQGDVAVISNRTPKKMVFAAAQKGKPQETIKLASGNVYSFYFNDVSALVFYDGQQNQQVFLQPQQVYFFGDLSDGRVFFQQMPLTGNPVGAFKLDDKTESDDSSSTVYSDLGIKTIEVPIKVYVDDNEQSRRSVWEPRLRRRFDKVNEVYERLCHVKFKIVEMGQWNSDNNINDFPLSMKEFELLAPNYPAALAIGFTSQYGIQPGVEHIGMTRQPFHTHILIREFAPEFTENERIEALIHELGHWLGAVHNPDPHCYMNPVLSGRQSRQVNYVKTFNPINTLLMNLWADCWSHRKNGLLYMADKRLEELMDIYSFMAKIPRTDSNANTIERLLGAVANQERERRNNIRMSADIFTSGYQPNQKKPAAAIIKPQLTIPDDLETLAQTLPELQDDLAESSDNIASDEESEKSEDSEDSADSQVAQDGSISPDNNRNNRPANSADTSGEIASVETGSGSNVNTNNRVDKKPSDQAVAEVETSVEPGEDSSDEDVPQMRKIVPSDNMSVNKSVKYVVQEMIKSVKPLEKSPRDNAYVNQLVQSAARAALQLPEKHQVRAFLVAIGLAMDSSNAMKTLPIIGDRVKKMDTYALQLQRSALIRQPTINDRSDWSQHFGVSAALSALMSPDAARQAGLIKELKDDQPGGSGFDCGDLAADMAGCTLAERLLKGKLTLDSVAVQFDVSRWIPQTKGYNPNLKKPDQVLQDVQKMVDQLL